MNRKRILMIVTIIALPLIAWVVYLIRQEHYPIDIQPSAHWETFASGLDAERERYFVESDGVLLEAELFIPRNGRSAKPAIVFSPGSGDSLYQNYSPDMIEKGVLDLFLQRDIAVLLVNKRGMGDSEGNWTKIDFQGRADDLYTAVSSLHNHPAIDSTQIGLVGHSQGGWIVSLTAAQHPDIAFFISLAGPTTTVAANMLDNYTGAYACDGFTGKELEAKAARQMRITRIGAQAGETIPFGMFGFDAGIIDYDPAEALQQVQSPALFVYAELDWMVTPAWSFNRLDEIFEGDVPEHFTGVTISGVNHSFHLVETACKQPAEEIISSELITLLNDWLTVQGY